MKSTENFEIPEEARFSKFFTAAMKKRELQQSAYSKRKIL